MSLRALRRPRTPRAPQRVETVQSGPVRGGSEVVQVDVGGHRCVPEPGLDSDRVDPFPEPKARCRVAEVVVMPRSA